MASTQKLTELPVIQYTGMDYSTVISQIREIIESNSNWKDNWTQFYSSEAGTMLVQLMAWICDNLAVRQDMLYNESFVGTAKNYQSKLRLLNQIKYDIKCSKAATVPITIKLEKIEGSEIKLSCYGFDETLADDSNSKTRIRSKIRNIKNSIFSFQAPNINGENVNWEILNYDTDGKIDYKTIIKLDGTDNIYSEYTSGSETIELKAIQGTTVYKEFTSATSEEPIFNLNEKDVDIDSIRVYDISGNNYDSDEGIFKPGAEHHYVSNFIDITTLNDNIPCFIVERNDDGYLQIRYPSKGLNSLLTKHLYKPAHTIGVFYRKCNGSEGNVKEEIFNVKKIIKKEVEGEGSKNINIEIVNEKSGYGGTDIEKIDDAIKNAPLLLRTLNRAVTSEDFNVILNNYNGILTSKTFTPDNMPYGFNSYYGREIYPHEAFSVVITNKNVNGISNENLNKFPWVQTIKSHAVNEKVSFSKHSFNEEVGSSDGVFGLFVEDSYVDDAKSAIIQNIDNPINKKLYMNSIYDDGSKYEIEHDDNKRLIRNAVIFNSGYNLVNDIVEEKSNSYNTPIGETYEYQIKVKLNSSEYDGNSFSEISNILFDDQTKYLKVDNNIIKEDTNATFTSIEEFSKIFSSDGAFTGRYESIDVSNIEKPLHIIIDDNVDLEINLKEEIKKEFKSKIGNLIKHLNDNGANIGVNIDNEINDDNVKDIYTIPLSNTINSKETLSFDFNVTDEIKEDFKDIYDFVMIYTGNLNGTAKSSYTKNSISTTLQASRKGIVEIINSVYKNKIEEIGNSENLYYINYKDGDNFSKEDYNTYINDSKKYKWISRQKKSFDNYNVDGIKKSYNGTLYQDINLNLPSYSKLNNKDKIENLPFYHKYETNSNREARNFYAIKINKYIYAIKINEKTINNAKYYYFSNDSDATEFKNYYKFDGINNAELPSQDEASSLAANSLAANVAIVKTDDINLKLSEERIENVFNSFKYSINKNNDNTNIESFCFCAETLALLLNYIFSQFNTDKDIIYKYDKNAKKWKDLHEAGANEKILNGGLKVSYINKKYYKYDALNKYSSKYSSDDYSDVCTDIRFEDIGTSENGMVIGSVIAEDFNGVNESDTNTVVNENNYIPTEGINGVDNIKDFFEGLFGYKRKYVSEFPDEQKIAGIIENEEDDTARLVIRSTKKGVDSSLYITNESEENKINDTFFSIFNCPNISKTILEDGSANFITPKVRGEKRMELFVAGVDYNTSSSEAKYYDGDSENSRSLTAGDIIVTDSDINLINIPTNSFISYVIKTNNFIDIDKQTNFYYSNNENATEHMIIDVVGLDGQVIEYKEDENGNKKPVINEEKSNFNFKITNTEQDTNNFFNIEGDDYVKCESFSISTNEIKYDGNISTSMSFALSIDDDNKLNVEDIYFDKNITAYNLIKNIVAAAKKTDYKHKDEITRIIREHPTNSNKIILSNLSNTNEGNITFYCIEDEEETTKEFFKVLFGTNKSNPEFYALYPKDIMPEENIIENDDTYWYSPVADKELVFKYRVFTDSSKQESKFADYYISCSKNSDDGFDYSFRLEKTDTSTLPDGYFYMHYINDRTYDKLKNEIDEVKINKYMEKYMIAGTELKYLNPYFKTFDIYGNVYYNENYNKSNIKNEIDKKLNDEYKIGNIKNIGIGNKIYLSDIINIISSVDGVEHVEITYFGFDKEKYSSSNKYLSIDEAHDFYTTILLAENDSKHGVHLEYLANEE